MVFRSNMCFITSCGEHNYDWIPFLEKLAALDQQAVEDLNDLLPGDWRTLLAKIQSHFQELLLRQGEIDSSPDAWSQI